MRILNLYHSSTGNNRLCAAVFEEEAAALGHDCRTVDIRDAGDGRELVEQIRGCDLFGLTVPTYYFKAPVNVVEFLDRLPVFEPKPFFVLNCRTDTTANTISMLANQLRKKNLFLIDSERVKGEESYPPFRFKRYIPGKGTPGEKELSRVRGFAKRVCEKAEAIPAGPDYAFKRKHHTVWPTPFHLIALASSRRHMLRFMLGKKLVPGACTACGVCARECPTKSIRLLPHDSDAIERRRDVTYRRRAALNAGLARGDGVVMLPVFADTCMGCYACVNLCPASAIYTPVANGRPPYRDRFANPENPPDTGAKPRTS